MTEPIVTAQTEAMFAEFSRSGMRELHLRSGEIEIYLSKDPSSLSAITRHQDAPAHSAAASPTLSKAAPSKVPSATPIMKITPGAAIVRAPNIGTFYGAPKPGAAAYVAVGSTVTTGSELCLIEVMKLFTAVRAEIDGRIDAILASDGEMVEAGQPLFAIVTN